MPAPVTSGLINVSVPGGPALDFAASEWNCVACSYRNKHFSSKCEICGAAHSQVTPISSPALLPPRQQEPQTVAKPESPSASAPCFFPSSPVASTVPFSSASLQVKHPHMQTVPIFPHPQPGPVTPHAVTAPVLSSPPTQTGPFQMVLLKYN